MEKTYEFNGLLKKLRYNYIVYITGGISFERGSEHMDHFLDDNNVIERLVEEWEKYGQIIIAVDFDNTIFDYYQRGYTYNDVINLLRECKDVGAYLMIYTSCEEEKFQGMITYMNENNIPFHSINQVPDYIPFRGKKLYYNILLDDRAGLSSAYYCLRQALNRIKGISGETKK